MSAENAEVFSNADWNLYAECYDTLLELQPYQELLATVGQALNPENSDAILDAGCGTGNLLLRLNEAGTTAALFGVDLSLEMLSLARRKCAQTSITLVRTDLNERFPYDDAVFSKISSVNVLYAVPDPAFTLGELQRVAKPGCTLVLVTPRKEYDNGLILKRHAKSDKPDEYWKGVHSSPEREEMLVKEALDDEKIAEKMLLVARYNRFISRTATFHFMTESEFKALVQQSGFVVTSQRGVYADQCMMITAVKD
jgi:ubiquinone/menaquinone biosynthesis C-methylase UbiE